MLVGSKNICSPQKTVEVGATLDLLAEYFFLSQQVISIMGVTVALWKINEKEIVRWTHLEITTLLDKNLKKKGFRI